MKQRTREAKRQEEKRVRGGNGYIDAIFRASTDTKEYAKIIFGRYNKEKKYAIVLKRKELYILRGKQISARLSYEYIEHLRATDVYAFDEVCKSILR